MRGGRVRGIAQQHDAAVCNVGPMEAGQVLVYQGVSCNWPSQPITIPSGPGQLLASYSVVYTGNVTCTSQPVPLQPLPQPTSTGALQGLAFLPDSKGHYDPANGCDRPNRKSVRATAK